MSVKYEKYLRSSHWRKRRIDFAKNHRKICKCGETKKLQLHHKNYDRLGEEKDSDLMWLCQSCHTLVEQLIDEGLLDRSCKGFFDKNRSVTIISKIDEYEKQRKERSNIIRKIEEARRKAKKSGNLKQRKLIEEFSAKYGFRY